MDIYSLWTHHHRQSIPRRFSQRRVLFYPFYFFIDDSHSCARWSCIGERGATLVSRVHTMFLLRLLVLSLSLCLFLSVSVSPLLVDYMLFSLSTVAPDTTRHTATGNRWTKKIYTGADVPAAVPRTAKQNRPEDVSELLRTLQTPLTAESASARLRRPTPLMRRPTASWLGHRPRQWRHRRATALSLVAHRNSPPRVMQRVAARALQSFFSTSRFSQSFAAERAIDDKCRAAYYVGLSERSPTTGDNEFFFSDQRIKEWGFGNRLLVDELMDD